MDSWSANFKTALIAKIQGKYNSQAKFTCDGVAMDFASYRERVGYMRALTDVVEMTKEVESSMNGEEKRGDTITSSRGPYD